MSAFPEPRVWKWRSNSASFANPPAVVMLSMHGDPLNVRRAREAGASAYVVKGSGIIELASAIVEQLKAASGHSRPAHLPPVRYSRNGSARYVDKLPAVRATSRSLLGSGSRCTPSTLTVCI